MIIKHHARRGRWSELDQLTIDDLVNNPPHRALDATAVLERLPRYASDMW
jgi:hypothetical protein